MARGGTTAGGAASGTGTNVGQATGDVAPNTPAAAPGAAAGNTTAAAGNATSPAVGADMPVNLGNASASIAIDGPSSWTPGAKTSLTFEGSTTLQPPPNGTLDLQYEWTATLLYNCDGSTPQNCDVLTLNSTQTGDAELTVGVPAYAGTLEVMLSVVPSGVKSDALTAMPMLLPGGGGGAACYCGGNRTVTVTHVIPPSATPSASASASASASFYNVTASYSPPPGVYSAANAASNSGVVLGIAVTAGAVVGLALVWAALYLTGEECETAVRCTSECASGLRLLGVLKSTAVASSAVHGCMLLTLRAPTTSATPFLIVRRQVSRTCWD
jgi:hypothetical protein